MKRLIRTGTYLADLDRIERYIAQNSPQAASDLWEHIDAQVDQLADANFPRRRGRVPNTFELVAHRNYVVIFQESGTTITVLNVVHVRRQYP